jgi:hypothetical protein
VVEPSDCALILDSRLSRHEHFLSRTRAYSKNILLTPSPVNRTFHVQFLSNPLLADSRSALEHLHHVHAAQISPHRLPKKRGERESAGAPILGATGKALTGVDPKMDANCHELLTDPYLPCKKEGTVMMIGDGVNDAPALATANLGFAMGAAGTDVAMETADVVLMGDRLENIPLMLGIARHARRVLTQNLTFAGGVIVVLIAAALGFDLALPLGVVGHEGSTVIVCLNGLRLLVYRG